MRFEDGENDVLLAGARDTLEAHFIGDFQQFGNRFLLEVGKIHCMALV